MSRALSPLQGSILTLLEEAGGENICCIANSLSVVPGNLLELYVALKELDALGAISSEFRVERSLLETEFGMVYREGTWRWPGEGPIPEVFMTPAGEALFGE